MNNIYEQALLEEFERNILSGKITKEEISYMIENDLLTEEQSNVVNQNNQAIGYQPQQSQTQQRNVPVQNNNATITQWKRIEKIIELSKLRPELTRLAQANRGNKVIVSSVQAILQWFDYLKTNIGGSVINNQVKTTTNINPNQKIQ